jgi:hypothetical protein
VNPYGILDFREEEEEEEESIPTIRTEACLLTKQLITFNLFIYVHTH